MFSFTVLFLQLLLLLVCYVPKVMKNNATLIFVHHISITALGIGEEFILKGLTLRIWPFWCNQALTVLDPLLNRAPISKLLMQRKTVLRILKLRYFRIPHVLPLKTPTKNKNAKTKQEPVTGLLQKNDKSP